MCGIAGILAREAGARRGAEVLAATRALAHRGPDGEGFWLGTERGSGHREPNELGDAAWVALGHRRLSIVDLAGGAQPMASDEGDIVVTFNGEVYNQLELRRELE